MTKAHLPTRQIHLDFHTSPLIPDLLSEWDVNAFADTMKDAHVDSVTVFAKCHHGMSYYPTKIGHVLAGLRRHRGPILTVANWSGQWPGLVGLLNLNGSLTKAGVSYSTLWSKDFTDDFFLDGLRRWLSESYITHDTSHARALKPSSLTQDAQRLGQDLAGLGSKPWTLK